MVDRQIAARGIKDPAVLDAMVAVPRELFVRENLSKRAYDDSPLPIDDGQTISQPFIVASMAAAARLRPDSRVLEVGTGSGYGAAVLSEVAGQVWTIERIEHLADQARRRLADLGYDEVHVVHGDGTLGLPDEAPFDAIVVTASGPEVPESLLDQLADEGTLVIPVGPETHDQRLVRVRRRGDDFEQEDLGSVMFVPLVGDQGWGTGEREGSIGWSTRRNRPRLF